MSKNGNVLEKIYHELFILQPGDSVRVKDMSVKTGCTVAYASHILKMARIAGFLLMDVEGSLTFKKLPQKIDFLEAIRKHSGDYRKATRGTGVSRTTRKVPAEFKATEETLIPILQNILRENKELKEKVVKFKEYVKKQRKREILRIEEEMLD